MDKAININPNRVIFFGHGSEDGAVQALRDGNAEKLIHPVNLERIISAGVTAKHKSVNLNVMEVYGCSIGAGINEENLNALNATREDRGSRDLPSPKLKNAELYSEINPAVTYILNAGHNLTSNGVGAVERSANHDNLFKIILDKIIRQGETFKVLKKKSVTDPTKVFTFSAPKPTSASDLSSENIKRFLLEKIEEAASFYAENYGGGDLGEEERKILESYSKAVIGFDESRLRAMKFMYLCTEIGRGKTKYIDFYLEDFGPVHAERLRYFLHKSVSHLRADSLQYFCDKYDIKSFEGSLFERAAKYSYPCLQILCQKTGWSPDLNVAFNSRYFSPHSIDSLKTVATMVVYGAKLPKDKDLERISHGTQNFMPIYQTALYIRNLAISPGEARVNAFQKMIY